MNKPVHADPPGATSTATRRAAGGTPPKSARRRARELVLQGLYQWLLAREDAGAIHAHLTETPGFGKADQEHLDAVLHGTIRAATELESCIGPHLDRPLAELSPVERAILMMATFELLRMPEIPWRVVLNEAIEIAKAYGGIDGFRYVNGVLDRVAAQLRPVEVGQHARQRQAHAVPEHGAEDPHERECEDPHERRGEYPHERGDDA